MGVAEDAYERGLIAGKIDARLAEHDKHLDRINGSMESVADKMTELSGGINDLILAVQRLSDAGLADKATVIQTASALKAADQARRDKDETRWTPMARLGAAIAAITALAGAVVGIYLAVKG